MSSAMLPGQEEPLELLTFLKQKYMLDPIPLEGQPVEKGQWSQLKEALGDDPERIKDAAAGIKHFIQCSQLFLAQHQPTTMHYLAQGMGLELAGGDIVSMVAPEHLDQNHMGMEAAGAIPISIPRSQIGQHGIVPTSVVAVTGRQAEPYQQPQSHAQAQTNPLAPAIPRDPLSG